MKEINLITDFALPRLKEQIEEGKAIYDFVEEQVVFEPVGIKPIYNREGFLFIIMEHSQEVHAFRYKSGLFQLAGEKFRSVSLWLLAIFQRSLVKTLESLKLHLTREVKELPNPATWRLHSAQTIPIEETLVPLSKRLLLQSVAE